jgi:hypothetical protein
VEVVEGTTDPEEPEEPENPDNPDNPNSDKINGACVYPPAEDYVNNLNAYDCKNGVSAVKPHLDESVNKYIWTCPGENGGSDTSCQADYYPYAVCGSGEVGDECRSGTLNKATAYYSLGELTSWQCVSEEGDVPSSIKYEYVYRDGKLTKINFVYHDRDEDCRRGDVEEGDNTIINGKCGTSANSCSQGDPVSKGKEGNTILWECRSSSGGTTDSCSLVEEENPPVPDPVNGECGKSNGLFFNKAPAEDLCQKGKASSVYNESENVWSWTCSGLYNGENATCKTGSVSLSPKISGCYIEEGKSNCQLKDPFSWAVSGVASLLKLVTNTEVLNLESNSGSHPSLNINYPYSDLILKADDSELVRSRGWAICKDGLYWDNQLKQCTKPIPCPGDPDYEEPERPYWEYETTSSCVNNFVTVVGTCINYKESEGLFCRDKDGEEYQNKTKETKLPCRNNPPQPVNYSLSLGVIRQNGGINNENNRITDKNFKVTWEATKICRKI